MPENDPAHVHKFCTAVTAGDVSEPNPNARLFPDAIYSKKTYGGIVPALSTPCPNVNRRAPSETVVISAHRVTVSGAPPSSKGLIDAYDPEGKCSAGLLLVSKAPPAPELIVPAFHWTESVDVKPVQYQL